MQKAVFDGWKPPISMSMANCPIDSVRKCGSQDFECIVTIFANSWRQGGNLDVYTNGTTQFSGSSDYEQVHIEVTSTGNISGNEQPHKNLIYDPGIQPTKEKNDNLYVPIAVVSTLVLVGFVGYYFVRKRKRNLHTEIN